MTCMLRIGLFLGGLLVFGSPATTLRAGQGGAGDAVQDASPAYGYDAHGRRDPFVSLLARGAEPRPPTARPAGPAGILIGEVAVKGVVRDRTGFLAMIQGPDKRTYVVRPGEKLFDGSVKAITGDGVVFAQDVNDPLATVKQKEVQKAVRPSESRSR